MFPFTSLTSLSDTVLLVCLFIGRLVFNKSSSFLKNEASELKTILEITCQSEVHKNTKDAEIKNTNVRPRGWVIENI